MIIGNHQTIKLLKQKERATEGEEANLQSCLAGGCLDNHAHRHHYGLPYISAAHPAPQSQQELRKPFNDTTKWGM